MSFDLGVFYTTQLLTNAEAQIRYSAFCEGDFAPYLEPSPKISAFVKELTATYPQIDDVHEDQLDDCPWSIAFDISEGHVVMCIVWPQAEKMSATIIELANKHGLVCFDPQSDTIKAAPPGIHVQSKPWWKFWG